MAGNLQVKGDMKIEELIDNGFPETRVLLIGDVMLDRYLKGEVQRISPEAPVPILKYQQQIIRPGGAANVALNLKSLGAEVRIVSIVGIDTHGEKLMDILKNEGFEVSGIVRNGDRKTTVKTRIMAGGQQLLRVDEEEVKDISTSMASQVWDEIEACIEGWQPEMILFQDYNKGLLTQEIIQRTLSKAREGNIFTAVDPKREHFFDYKSVGLIKPNLKEVREALGWNCGIDVESLRKCVGALRERMDCVNVVITLSDKGIYVSSFNGDILAPTEAREIVDVCGAGDAVLSVVSLALYHGLEIGDIAEIANIAGGTVCGIAGVSPLPMRKWRKELEAKYRTIKG